ncbi:hypothetical protein [Leptolyngbya sp. FACHB-16]|uniref:hypothetical protein n=1 Tax=unclassified Leptolyngbya TaxID=2650499 RepID=UPI0016899EB4|nr:hypothetical protein [Leptolyngbya sp. FACHB-16]MBD2153134.1 hypothetical protein [Leptolyngbya sp. FACHB-16]
MSLASRKLKPQVMAGFVRGETPAELHRRYSEEVSHNTIYRWWNEWKKQESEIKRQPEAIAS